MEYYHSILFNILDSETPRVQRTPTGTEDGRRKQERVHRGAAESSRG